MNRVQIDKKSILNQITSGDIPPWRSVTSRTLARTLGVSLQVLANWRVREKGPQALSHRRGYGRRTHYQLSEVAAWASDGSIEAWQVSRDWLSKRGLEVAENSQASTEWLIAAADPFIVK